jgi:hypothetical protein
MPALLARAHETDTNAWYPVAPSHSPGPALSMDSAAALKPIIDGVENDPDLGKMSGSSCEPKRGEGQEMTEHEVSRKGTLAQRNDMS